MTLAPSVSGVIGVFPSALFMGSLFSTQMLFLFSLVAYMPRHPFTSVQWQPSEGTGSLGVLASGNLPSRCFSCLHRFLPFDVVAPEDEGTGTRPLVTQLVLVSDPKASVLQGATCLMELAVRTRPHPGASVPRAGRHLWLPVAVDRPRRWPLLWTKESAVLLGARRPPALSVCSSVSPNSWQRSVGLEARILICLGCLPAHF